MDNDGWGNDLPELTKAVQKIVHLQVGTGKYKPGWKRGDDEIEQAFDDPRPIFWTTIECSQCGDQVYFDKLMKRHRCSSCGYGF